MSIRPGIRLDVELCGGDRPVSAHPMRIVDPLRVAFGVGDEHFLPVESDPYRFPE